MNTHENARTVQSYTSQLEIALKNIDCFRLAAIAKKIVDLVSEGRQIFLIGNGGSSSIVEHFYTDLMKTVSQNLDGNEIQWVPKLNVLTGPSSLMFALSNDLNFESIFSWQIEKYLNEGDCLIAVSSSGNSANILAAARLARKKGGTIIGFCGFEDPELKKFSNLFIHINSNNYGIVEDLHSVSLHAIIQEIISLINKQTSN